MNARSPIRLFAGRPLWRLGLLISLGVVTSFFGDFVMAETQSVYIGTYTDGDSEGIYLFDLDLNTGKLSNRRLAVKVERPSFLSISPDGTHLYSVSEVADFEGKPTGSVSAFKIGSDGLLTSLNHQESKGTGPCHVTVDREGKNLLVANYGGGSIACLPIKDDGSLAPATSFVQHAGSSVHPKRQTGPHAHSINVSKNNKFAYVADLGLDRVMIYEFDAGRGILKSHKSTSASVQPGAGPRHFAFRPDANFAYVINEMNSTVTAFSLNLADGQLEEIQTLSTLPEDFSGNNSTAEVQVHPSGKFLYGSNRGHDSIAVFAIDDKTGKLTHVETEKTGGETPRNFGIDPTGQFLLAANQKTHDIFVFRINQETGELEPTGEKAECPSPVCVKFLQR